MDFDNIVIHYFACTDCIAKTAVNLRQGNKIIFRLALKDIKAANAWIESRGYGGMPCKVIWHWI